MPLDEQLISRSNSRQNDENNSENEGESFDSGENDSSTRSGNLREAMRGNKNFNSSNSQGDFRADRIAALRLAGTKKTEDKAVGELISPAKKSISKLLQSAWINIIDTFGLSVIWIDIHIFLSQVLGKDLFCSLGEEWLPAGAPKNLKGAKKSVGIAEGMAVFGLNVGCLLLILFLLSLVAMIVSAITNPLDVIKAIFGSLWQAISN